MALKAVVNFWQDVRKNQALRGKVEGSGVVPEFRPGISASEFDGLSAIARESGHDCSSEDLRAAETVARFWSRVDEDETLQKKLISSDSMERDQAVSFIGNVAKDSGFNFSLEQLDVFTKAKVQAIQALTGELSETQLEGVAGGANLGTLTLSSSSFDVFAPLSASGFTGGTYYKYYTF
jgi:hypothetical protein